MELVWTYFQMLALTLREARASLAERGIPVGAALFNSGGVVLASGHNRRVQGNDPTAHAVVDAFRRAGRLPSYRDIVVVTTLAPCWYCSGLIRQFGIRTIVVGESRTLQGGVPWLRSLGIDIIDLDSEECATLLQQYIREHADIWREDIGPDGAWMPA